MMPLISIKCLIVVILFLPNAQLYRIDALSIFQNTSINDPNGVLENETNILLETDINIDRYETLKIVKNDLQMFIMDKIKQVYIFKNSSNENCRTTSLIYSSALDDYEPWALKMLDSSSKIQSGLIAGNIADFGSYTQCVRIINAGRDENINGKYCLLAMLPPEVWLMKILNYRGITNKFYQNMKAAFFNASLEWAICIPDICEPEDVFEHFDHMVNEVFEGMEITLQPNIECSTLKDIEKPFNSTEKLVFVIVATLITLVVISTIIEIYKQKNRKEEGNEIIFSIWANSRWLLFTNVSHQQMACLNGIRVLSIIMVIIGHRYLMTVFFAAVNQFEFLDWVLNYTSQIIIGGTVTVDSFLLLSGLLLTYHFLLSHHNGVKFNYPLYLLHRYLRLTPSYAFAILIISVYGHRFSKGGPKWDQTWKSIQKPCQNYWWTSLLYIQSYLNPKEVCFLQCWYLSIDTIYYVLAPLLLIPLIKNKHAGLFCILVAYILSVWINFYQSLTKKWLVNALYFDKQLPTSAFFTKHYTQPHIRASPYIIGMVFGYILFRYRDIKVKMSPIVVALGWLGFFGVMIVVILSNRIFLDPDYDYNALNAAIYLSVHRSVWVLGLCWMIWACVHGYGGPINTLLSGHIFTILGKLVYSAYLIHMQFQFYDNGANKLPNFFSNMTLIRVGFGDVAVSFILGYFLTILVECPVYRLSLLLFKGRKKPENKIILVKTQKTQT